MKFQIGDMVKLVPNKGPARYKGRTAEIVSTRSKGRGVQYGIQFLSRRATPLFVGRSFLQLL